MDMQNYLSFAGETYSLGCFAMLSQRVHGRPFRQRRFAAVSLNPVLNSKKRGQSLVSVAVFFVLVSFGRRICVLPCIHLHDKYDFLKYVRTCPEEDI